MMQKRIFIILFVLFSMLILFCSQQTDSNSAPEKLLGILGGMGPEATADLYHQIVSLTPAEKDQEHIPTIIYSLPQIPDRMEAIRSSSGEIIPFLIEGLTRLEKAGASYIAIPCNTVHYFYDEMQKAVNIPIIHMIRETADVVESNYSELKTVGLLATTGTIESGLYTKELESRGFTVIVPDDDIENDNVMKAVWGIKSGVDRQINEDLLAIAGNHLLEKGAKVIVLGCTEIPLAFNPDRVTVPVVNATRVLAEAAIRKYGK